MIRPNDVFPAAAGQSLWPEEETRIPRQDTGAANSNECMA